MMMDLEERALRRDRRFLVRLVLGSILGLVVGVILYAKMTSAELGGCAASMFSRTTGADAPRTESNPAPSGDR